MKTALFVGRFQPFHLGHLSVLQEIDDADVDKIIIGVGSSQYSQTKDNPYTFAKRKTMIERALKDKIKKQVQIIAVPDIHDDERWVGHVAEIVGKFDLVYTGNDLVKKMFESKGYKTKAITFKHNISGTKLREMMKENNLDWKKHVPESIINLL